MGLRTGLIGLANVGKTTVFNALVTGRATAANYPFATVEPSIGVVPLADRRLDRLAEIFRSKKVTPSTLEVRDIAGLVKGASQGDGLGNQFLAQIREVDALIHVVRCFDAPDVVHVAGSVDPARDVEVVETELMLTDLQMLERRRERTAKRVKAGEAKAARESELVERLSQLLNHGEWLAGHPFSFEERALLKEIPLLTLKPVVFVANMGEAAGSGDRYVLAVRELGAKRGAPVVPLCGQLEAELASLGVEEREDYLRELGLGESGLSRLTRTAYTLLSLITFFTAGEEEARAWPIRKGTRAAEAAGKIHSDMERGFIRAEVFTFDDLVACGNVAAIREQGLFRLEGRDYELKEGDVVYFRFNV